MQRFKCQYTIVASSHIISAVAMKLLPDDMALVSIGAVSATVFKSYKDSQVCVNPPIRSSKRQEWQFTLTQNTSIKKEGKPASSTDGRVKAYGP